MRNKISEVEEHGSRREIMAVFNHCGSDGKQRSPSERDWMFLSINRVPHVSTYKYT